MLKQENPLPSIHLTLAPLVPFLQEFQIYITDKICSPTKRCGIKMNGTKNLINANGTRN